MKLQLLSDLHLEANPDFVPQPAPGADLLVLAGDVGSYQLRRDGSAMAESDWGLGRFAHWPVPVLFVPGNHEYDALDVDEAHAQLRATCERLGLIWLERAQHVVQGVRFLGTTLWSDYDALGDRGKAFRAANHYLTKMAGQRHGRLFDAEAMRELALDCQRWLRGALAEPFDGTTVVVTHFAPTLHSMDPRYGRSPEGPGMYLVNAKGELVPHWSPEAPRYIRTLAKPYATHARAQMNHYMLRSAETFSLKAGTRAPVSLTDRYTDAYRARADKGNEPDMSAFHYADAFTALHAQAMELPDVARLHLLCCADHLRLIAEKHGRRVEEDARWHEYLARAKALEAG